MDRPALGRRQAPGSARSGRGRAVSSPLVPQHAHDVRGRRADWRLRALTDPIPYHPARSMWRVPANAGCGSPAGCRRVPPALVRAASAKRSGRRRRGSPPWRRSAGDRRRGVAEPAGQEPGEQLVLADIALTNSSRPERYIWSRYRSQLPGSPWAVASSSEASAT